MACPQSLPPGLVLFQNSLSWKGPAGLQPLAVWSEPWATLACSTVACLSSLTSVISHPRQSTAQTSKISTRDLSRQYIHSPLLWGRTQCHVGEVLLTWVRKAVSGLQNTALFAHESYAIPGDSDSTAEGRPRCPPHSKLTTAVLEGLA